MSTDENQYRAFINNSNEGIYRVEFRVPISTQLPADEQIRLAIESGYIAEWNQAVTQSFDLSNEVIANMTLDTAYPLIDVSRIEVMRHFIASNYRLNNIEIHRLESEGKATSSLLNVTGIVENGQLMCIWGTHTFITERLKAEQALKESEANLAEAQTMAHIGHWVRDIHKNEISWSDEVFRILGHQPQSFKPTLKRFALMIHAKDRKAVIKAFRDAVDKTVTIEFRGLRPDGSQRIIQGTARGRKNEAGEPIRLFGTIQDITERKQLEFKARQQELALIQADKLSSLGLMVSGVAHEINNPNNLIQMNAGLLKDMWQDMAPILDKFIDEHDPVIIGGLESNEASQYLPELIDGLTVASRRIQQIVSDLKHFSRRGDSHVLSNISVNETIHTAIQLMRPLLQAKTHNLILDLSSDQPALLANPQHLEQIIINLLVNALEALPDKTYNVWISSALNPTRREVEIQVRDNGVGIPVEHIKNIFDPFYTTKQDQGGTGLGLAISYNLVKAYQGSLTCQSTAEAGTVFVLRFPAIAAT